ncbi:hypothetical protein BDZ89DRAFT_1055213 [Hymenopellis radicata]|nr:hypothetical protein BDZ89DRAFT_1055213 [Hymenopellis radicata]
MSMNILEYRLASVSKQQEDFEDTGDATNEDADSDHLGNDNSDALDRYASKTSLKLVALQICRATRDAPSSKPFPVGGFSGPRVPHIKWVPSKQQWKEGASRKRGVRFPKKMCIHYYGRFPAPASGVGYGEGEEYPMNRACSKCSHQAGSHAAPQLRKFSVLSHYSEWLFDPNCSAQLVLDKFKLIINFPAGTSIFISSAIVTHWNLPSAYGETHYSITQYSLEGLFRWMYHGFRTKLAFEHEVSDEILEQAERNRSTRWMDNLKYFLKIM